MESEWIGIEVGIGILDLAEWASIYTAGKSVLVSHTSLSRSNRALIG